MAFDYGHVKISRRAYATDPYWNEPREFSRWEAWEWMIQAAAWKPYSKVTKRAGVLKIERGETPPLAERFLADHWGWGSKNRARRFLEELQVIGRIRTGQRTAEGITYHLVNYDAYQSTKSADGPLADQTRTAVSAEIANSERKTDRAGRDKRTAQHGAENGVNASGGPDADRTTDRSRTRRGPDADQNRSRESSKAEKENRTGARASRKDSEAARLTDLVVLRGLSGVEPSDYSRQEIHAEQLLRQQSLEYWTGAMDHMNSLFPHSRGDPWDVFDLGRKATKAMAMAKTSTENAGDNPADDWDPDAEVYI